MNTNEESMRKHAKYSKDTNKNIADEPGKEGKVKHRVK